MQKKNSKISKDYPLSYNKKINQRSISAYIIAKIMLKIYFTNKIIIQNFTY